MRSALSIPLNLEARAANAAPDTLNKTVIARKEAAETRRTLLVLRDVGLLSAADADELSQLIDEVHHLLAMLMAGTKKLQHRVDKSTSNTARRKRQMLSTL